MTLIDITSAVLNIIGEYSVYIMAGAVFGIAIYGIRKLVKASNYDDGGYQEFEDLKNDLKSRGEW